LENAMQQCPKCESRTIHRSHSRGRWEQLRKHVTGKRPHRCSKCGWRGWAIASDEPPRDAELYAPDREEQHT